MHRALITCCFAIIVPQLSAQELEQEVALTPEQIAGIGTEALPGTIPGTRRYNVTFEKRSFDLRVLRNAYESGVSGPLMQRMIEDLQARANEDHEKFRMQVEALGGRKLTSFWLINAATIEIAPEHVAKIEKLDNVLWVHPDLATYPLGPRLPIKTATDANHHNADAEQAKGNKGTLVAVAIVDTSQADNTNGPNQPHRTYYRNGDKTNTTGGGIGGSRLIGNFKIGSQAANNTHPHGTGVASIAAGGDWGTAGADHGHAYDALVLGYSICNSSGNCGSSLSTEAQGWQKVAADKLAKLANIVSGNMSYGSSPNPRDVSQQAIDSCATLADVLPVTAAGNSGSSTSGSSSTANGLAVGATSNSKVVASFSSRGPLAGSSRYFPDIAANGVSTVMARNTSEGSDYVGSGTSMASPQVCGAAALVRNARPGLSALETKAILLCATEDISSQNSNRGRNYYGLGYLRDDLASDLARATNRVQTCAIANTSVPTIHRIAVTANQQYSIAIAWYRMVMTHDHSQWSDLNLTVKNGSTVVASSSDPQNLYEKVTFTAPISGSLTVEVSATRLEPTVPCVDYALASDAQILTTCQTCPGKCPGSADYQTYGAGCPGSGQTHTGGVILPAANATRMGDTSANFPYSLKNVRFQQVLLASEAGNAATWDSLALRQDSGKQSSAAASQRLKILLGKTTAGLNNLQLKFASNYAGTMTTVFDSTLNLPPLSGSNSDPTIFKVRIPFAAPYKYAPVTGQNILLEVQNSSTSDAPHTFDAVSASGSNTACSVAFNVTDTDAAVVIPNYGPVVCFGIPGGPGATPRLTSTGAPTVGGSYTVDLDLAAPNSISILLLGVSDKTWNGLILPFDLAPFGAPGCKLLASGDIMVPTVSDNTGAASMQFSVPLDNNFCGLRLYHQYLVIDKAANNGHLVTTNGGVAIHGS